MPAWLTLALVLLLTLALLIAAAAALMARQLLRPPRLGDGKALYLLKRLSPADLGLAYSPLEFTVLDEPGGGRLKLAAWWIPREAAAGRCAVLIHGYADAKVGALAWAPLWHDLGYNLLVIDLRAHGQSEGTRITVGDRERHDLGQVLDQLRAQKPADTRSLVLFGASLGGAVALATALEREDIAAVVLDSPFADFPTAARSHFQMLGLPGGAVQELALRLARWQLGFAFEEFAPLHTLPRLSCPVLAVLPENDPIMTPDQRAEMQRILAALPAPSAAWVVSEATHLRALEADPEAYRRRLGEFLA